LYQNPIFEKGPLIVPTIALSTPARRSSCFNSILIHDNIRAEICMNR
jgi:hypothetical protein